MARPARINPRLQAVLYYARKRRLARLKAQQEEENPEPEEE